MIRYAVRAFGRADDRAPLPDNLSGGAHALDGLIQILVQRIAGVGSDNNVKRFIHRVHCRLLDKPAAFAMRDDHVAGKNAGNLFLAVQRHVQHKVGFDHQAVLRRRILQDISLDNPPGAERMTNHLGVVEIENRVDAGHTGIDALGSAGKPGKEVRLDEAGHNFEFRFHIGLVEKHFRAVTIPADTDQFGVIECIVVFDPHRIDDLPAKHGDQLVLGVGAVAAQAIDDDKVLTRHVAEFFENPGHQFMIWRRTGDVRNHDGDSISAVNHVFERRRPHRIPHCRHHSRLVIGQRRQMTRFDHHSRFGDFNGQTAFPIGQFNFFHVKSSLPGQTLPITFNRLQPGLSLAYRSLCFPAVYS